jgi:hypothetical protein
VSGAKLPPAPSVAVRLTFCTWVNPDGVLVVVETTGARSPKRGSAASIAIVSVPWGVFSHVLRVVGKVACVAHGSPTPKSLARAPETPASGPSRPSSGRIVAFD